MITRLRTKIKCFLGFHKWLKIMESYPDHEPIHVGWGCLYCGRQKYFDSYEKARLNAANECLKQNKVISGKLYPDGSITVDKS